MTTKQQQIRPFHPSIAASNDGNIPSIKHCADTIKSLSHDIHNRTKDLAQLFTSCVALLIHLDVDRANIEAAIRDETSSPNDIDTPAINSVLGDKQLFEAFLNMLHSPISNANAHPSKRPSLNKSQVKSSHHHHHQQPMSHTINRKRAFSHDNSETPIKQPNKVAKKMLSPNIAVSKESMFNNTNSNSPKLLALPMIGGSSHNHDKQSPLMKIPYSVLAASVLYSALRYVDHWPAVLAKAYAEDSFGARSWVDDKRCNQFTKNIALVLTQDASKSCEDVVNSESVATIFVDSFQKFFSAVDNDDETCTPEDPAHRPAHLPKFSINGNRMNMDQRPSKRARTASDVGSKPAAKKSSDSSSDSDSSGDEECVLEVSVGSALKFTTPSTDGQFDDPPSPATDENKKKTTKKKVNRKGSSSSGKEERGKDITTKSGSIRQHYSNDEMKSKSSSRREKEISASAVTSLESKKFHCKSSRRWWNLGDHETKSTVLQPCYPRFIGSNKALAHKMIIEALSNRLSARGVKQNSNFLSTLPSFVTLPEIRKLAAEHLEKWLQSPAVSLLAQSLLSTIVSEIDNVIPPLDEDLSAIDSILSMNLKGNQFIFQKENVTSIAKSVPSTAISSHLVSRLLAEELKSMNDTEIQTLPDVSENLEMFRAVHTTLDPTLAYGALSKFMLLFLSRGDLSKSECNSRLTELRNLLQRVVGALGNDYDGFLLVKAMLDRDWHENSDVKLDDVARIVFECVILMIPLETSGAVVLSHRGLPKSSRKGINFRNERVSSNNHSSLQDTQNLSAKLLGVRKVILKWCLNCLSTNLKKEKKLKSRTLLKPHLVEGAGIPDYASVLDGEAKPDISTSKNPRWIIFTRTLRCLLFMEKPHSIDLSSFLAPDLQPGMERDVMSAERAHQIQICCDYGVDVDTDIMRLIFEAINAPSSAIDAPFGVSLIEHLFYLCREGQKSVLKINDCNVIWDLYKLTEYTPNRSSSSNNYCESSSDHDNNLDEEHNAVKKNNDIPRLAYPGLWWRVTAIALIICGKSPQPVGARCWDELPTLRALIKMTTAEKYRFPTSDCNDTERETIKKKQNRLKEKEAKISEILFFPEPNTRKKKVKRENLMTTSSGLRVSARQKAKQDKIIANKRKKQIEEALTEERRKKKLLRAAQKSIMIWDPSSSARKPPKESIDLILSVKSLFDLSNAFKECIDPDFLLRTIGSSSRDSIERAYDWLIPIISSHPNMISRLPPSASCYLLLRVFGVDNSGNHQLLKLSAPLLKHVTQCLTVFGQKDAQRAASILFYDIADQNPDRRRCARRALHESLGELENVNEYKYVISGKFSWLFSLLNTKHSSDIVASAIPNLSRALAFERGGVLRAYILALHHYSEKIPTSEQFNFASVLCDLLSVRPHVCRSLMDRFSDVRDLTIEVVHGEFDKCISNCVAADSNEISMFINTSSQENHNKSEIKMNLPLLRATIVLISNWRDDDKSKDKLSEAPHLVSKAALMSLVKYLIPSSIDGACKVNTPDVGAASAKFIANGRRGVSVEEWVMLAKSRCDFIARHSALSTPNVFLPRLLLCCGLPQSSLVSMIERLGQLGDESSNHDKCFGELLSPSVTAEWGVGHTIKRSLITRKLLGRISADINILRSKEDCDASIIKRVASSSFVSWLEKECENGEDKLKRSRSKKKNNTWLIKEQNMLLHDLKDVSSVSATFSSTFNENDDLQNRAELEQISDIEGNIMPCVGSNFSPVTNTDIRNSKKLIFDLMNVDLAELDSVIGQLYANLVTRRLGLTFDGFVQVTDNRAVHHTDLLLDGATKLLLRYRSLHARPLIFTRIILKWIPMLSEYCKETFWEILFSKQLDDISDLKDTIDLLVTRCIASWSVSHVSSCQSWILKKVMTEELHRYSTSSFLKCLVYKTSQISSCDVPLIFRDSAEDSKLLAIDQQPETVAAFQLAINGAKYWYQRSDLKIIGGERNLLPDWMVLMLLIGRQGKKHLNLITTMLVERIPSDTWEGQILPGTLLRLYSQFPCAMNLNNGKTRKVLVSTAAQMASEWLKWRTIFDERIERMILNLVTNPNQRQQQMLTDISKRHPLIFCRQISSMSDALLRDAAVTPLQQDAERRGNVLGAPVHSTLVAQIESNTIKVATIQWGNEFNETLWLSILDILMALPEEVIFVCGHQMGLLRLLNLYLKLLVTHSLTETVENNSNSGLLRIKSKFLNFANNFHTSNQSKCELWLKREIFGVLKTSCTVRDLFDACDMKFIKNGKG